MAKLLLKMKDCRATLAFGLLSASNHNWCQKKKKTRKIKRKKDIARTLPGAGALSFRRAFFFFIQLGWIFDNWMISTAKRCVLCSQSQLNFTKIVFNLINVESSSSCVCCLVLVWLDCVAAQSTDTITYYFEKEESLDQSSPPAPAFKKIMWRAFILWSLKPALWFLFHYARSGGRATRTSVRRAFKFSELFGVQKPGSDSFLTW